MWAFKGVDGIIYFLFLLYVRVFLFVQDFDNTNLFLQLLMCAAFQPLF